MNDNKILKDITYDKRSGMKLDLYFSEKEKNSPVLIWFHGGGLTMNTKEVWEVVHFGERFSQEKFIVIAPDYRKSPQVKYPVFVEDAASSFAWVFNNIEKYGGNRKQIFVGGHSAGAYLAAMIAMAPKFLALHGIDNREIAGLIPVSGQMDTHQCVREERNITEEGFYADDAAPWHYIKPDLFPILVMVADNDLPGRADTNRDFVNALHNSGHLNSKYIKIPGREHVSIIEDILKPEAPVSTNILQFIKNYSC